MSIEGDPADPATWHRAMLCAIVGLQREDRSAAVEYLQFVELHRGREQAMAARARLRELQGSEAFADAAEQLAALNTSSRR